MDGIIGFPTLGNDSTPSTLIQYFTQTSPSFSVGDFVRFNGVNWVDSIADSGSDSIVYGYVLGSIAGGQYLLATSGYITGLAGLTAGDVYYLSSTIAGRYTSTAPTIAVPLFRALTSTTAIMYNQTTVGGGGGGGGSLITDGTKQSNLSNNANWDSLVGGNYIGTPITGQSEHDYFVDASYKYEMVFIGASLLPIRLLRTPS